MALLWMDGFDTLGAHDTWASVLTSSGYVASVGKFNNQTRTGRGLCIRFDWFSSGSTREITRAFPTRDTVIVGFAFYMSNLATLTRVAELRYDNLAGTVQHQLYLEASATGTLVVKQGGTGTIIAQSDPNTIFPGVWNYIEIKATAGRPGNVVVRLNGGTVAAGSGSTVHNSMPIGYNLIRFPQYLLEDASNHEKAVDDFYLCDATGTLFNDFCGDVVIHGMMPYQDAGPNDMQAFGGGLSNYTAIDDIPPDEDLSYLYSNTAGHSDMFDLDNLPANIIDVLAVGVHARARKDAPGTSNIKLLARYLDDTAASPSKYLSTVYMGQHHFFEIAPDGGSWNKLKANNLNIGVEVA